MEKDPVCKGDVDASSAWSSTYQGKTYYFTSADCKAGFDRDPEHYAAEHYTAETKRTAEGGAAGIKEKGEKAASQARSRVRTMITGQKDKVAEGIGSVSMALRTVSERLREQKQESFARYADSAAIRVDDFSGYLQRTDADQIINESEDLVRRSPGLFIGGAFAAGFFMARFLKSSRSVST